MAVSLSLPPVMDVSEAITIKNTFIDDWVTPAAAPKRRCSSVPRSWMPAECGKSVEGDESTAASDSGNDICSPTNDLDSLVGSDYDTSTSVSDFECMECNADPKVESSGWSAVSEETPTSKPLVKVKLLDFVGDAPPPKSATQASKTKLRASARPFASLRATPAGIQTVIQAAKDVLETDPSIASVQMLESAMGGTCTLIAYTRADALPRNPRYCVTAAKNALLTSAEHSQDTYILGYDTKPFTKIDKYGFSATLASIPSSQHSTACWDSYKNGCCPRRSTCRWTHPCESQVMRLVIRIHRACESPVNEKKEKKEKSSQHDKEFPGHLVMLQRCAMVLSGVATELGAGQRVGNSHSTSKQSEF